MEEIRKRLTPKEELRNALEAVKSELEKAQSWVFAHPEVWSAEFADEFKDSVNDIREMIDELTSRAYEEAEEREF
jgi:gas vesicle protein